MPNLNKVQLIGHLGKDPELKYTPSGQSVTSFSVATSEKWKDKSGQPQQKTEWHNIVAWGQPAEYCATYLKKGSAVYIEGKLQTRKWQDKSGADRYTTEVVASSIQGLSGGNGGKEKVESPTVTNAKNILGATEKDLDTGEGDIPF